MAVLGNYAHPRELLSLVCLLASTSHPKSGTTRPGLKFLYGSIGLSEFQHSVKYQGYGDLPFYFLVNKLEVHMACF